MNLFKHNKPKLGEQLLCYYVMERYNGEIVTGFRVLFYVKWTKDKRRFVFSDTMEAYGPYGDVNWPVTHWERLPDEKLLTKTNAKKRKLEIE